MGGGPVRAYTLVSMLQKSTKIMFFGKFKLKFVEILAFLEIFDCFLALIEIFSAPERVPFCLS